ncbi:MAG: hypothetical protein IPM29_17510 [Planctomycetes bacterium]|nr:hypothetical protein [Planctomycetota bacterium]
MIPHRSARLSVTLVLALAALAACFDVRRRSGVTAGSAQFEVAVGTVGPDGGVIEPAADSGSLHPGLRLRIPAGALAEPVEIRVLARYGDPRFPSAVQTFRFEPVGLRFAVPATVTIDYAEVYERTVGAVWAAETIGLWSFRDDPSRDALLLPDPERDIEHRTVSGTLDELGTCFAMHPQLRVLIHQEPRLVDPAELQHAAYDNGLLVPTPNGELDVQVGQGSLASFWQSGAEDNLLVIHGSLGSAVSLGTSASLATALPGAGFNALFANVVVFEYPSGRSIRENANRLYDLLRDGAGPGFGCRIVAHGAGGLLARYALERAHTDADRPGYAPGDPPLTDHVDRVVLVATPNQGADLESSPFGAVAAIATATDRPLVQGLLDLDVGPAGFVASLNVDWAGPSIEYFAIAGDVGSASSDGFVAVDSGVGLNGVLAWQVFSGPLYDHLALPAFADRTGVVEQALVWLGPPNENTRPIVGSVAPPEPVGDGVVAVRFQLTDAESDLAVVLVEVAVDTGTFAPATPAPGSRNPLLLVGGPAPGTAQEFRWDARRDLRGGPPSREVVVRITPLVTSGPGTPGQTGRTLVTVD